MSLGCLQAFNEASGLITGLFDFARNLTDLVKGEDGIVRNLFEANDTDIT